MLRKPDKEVPRHKKRNIYTGIDTGIQLPYYLHLKILSY